MGDSNHATTRDVLDEADQWDISVLECRSLGHIWSAIPARTFEDDQLHYVHAVEICPRCLTERHSEWSSGFKVLYGKPWLIYKDHYKRRPGKGRLPEGSRALLRGMAIQKSIGAPKKLTAKQRKTNNQPRSKAAKAEVLSIMEKLNARAAKRQPARKATTKRRSA